jgi:transposase
LFSAFPLKSLIFQLCRDDNLSMSEGQDKIAVLEAENARLRAENEKLKALVEELQRKQHRPHAPFSKGDPKPNPKPPGRKAGDNYGTRAYRKAPLRADQHYDAPLPPSCPHCSGKLEERGVAAQYQTEIPRKPIVRRFEVHLGVCACCGKHVQGRHPLQTSDALGAAASQLGPDAQALGATLNKEAGLSHGKIQRVFEAAFGITFSRGASAQIMLRAAQRCGSAYREIQSAVKNSSWCVPDETGWRVGGRLHWLHVFVTDWATLYLIRGSRGFDVAAEALGADYNGYLTHDGWKPYDQFTNAYHGQCNAHLLRRCEHLLETATGAAVLFPRRVKALLQEGLVVRDAREAGTFSLAQAQAQAAELTARLEACCSPKTDPGNRRLANFLRWRLGEVFNYLRRPLLFATNWPAEQAVRPAVVNRKVWGGSRTADGAEAQGVLMSVLRTATKLGHDTLGFLSQTLRAAPGHLPRLILTTSCAASP